MLWIANRAARKPIIYLESVLYTAAALLLFLLLNPSDPLFIQSSFPWIWLICIAIALRAGPVAGLLSYTTVLLGFYVFAASSLTSLDTHLNLLGGLILTILCGEFASRSYVKIRQWRDISVYTEQQLDLTAHAYYLLKQSHNHLEQQLITAPTTLRSSMSELRALIRESNGRFEKSHCEFLLRLISHYCSIQSSGFYLWNNGVISKEAFCENELQTPLDIHDPVLVRAMKEMVPYANTKLNDIELQNSHYLMAYPVISFDKVCFAFFVINKMPFFSYHEENFQFIRMILEYYANSIVLYRTPMPLCKIYPDCPAPFAFELQRMILLKQQMKMTSYLVAIFIDDHARQDAILYELRKNNRGLDVQWKHRLPSSIALLIVMPFCHYSDVVGYRNRLKKFPDVDLSINVDPPLLRFSSLPIEKNSDSVELIKRILAT